MARENERYPVRTDPEVQRAAGLYQLGLPRVPVSGRTGELLGRGTGSSVEFQEYREYFPGDDVRHLDWAAYARSDTLMVRLYREEISPNTEVLLDTSVSMTTGESGQKRRLATQLTALFAMLAGQLGARTRIRLLGDEPSVPSLSVEELDRLADWPFTARRPLPDVLQSGGLRLQRQSVRVVLSDFLFPHDPERLLRNLAAASSSLWLVQILTRWEADPQPVGGRHLLDVETDFENDLLIDHQAIAAYRRRLVQLQESLLASCRRVHATLVTVVADEGLEAVCREPLMRSGILRTK